MDATAGAPSEERRSARQERRRAATRERLVVAAQDLLAEVGVAASIQAIADRADLAIGSLYYHFPDKSALFEAAVDAARADFEASFLPATEHLTDPAERICARVRMYCRATDTHPRFARVRVNTFGGWVSMGPGYRYEAWADVTGAIEAGDPQNAAPHPDMATMTIVGGAISVIAMRLKNPDLGPQIADDYAENMLVLLGQDVKRARELVNRPLPEFLPATS